MSQSRFYVTTPIYYINDTPHLGTAYTTIVADALARYHRAQGRAVHFLTGTDEHGEKVEEAARKARLEPQVHADRIVKQFRDTWPKLDIEYDDFIRTTEDRHRQVVQDMWRRMQAVGDIYLGEYQGLYCVGCEAYYTDSEAVDGKCPTHLRPLDRRKQASYFFKLSRYQEPLLQHYRDNPGFVRPESRLNEVSTFVSSGLRDLSISRVSFRWGIPVPDDPDHVIYVWIDALTNYISALGGPGAQAYKQYWPADVHLLGKDIVRFHAVYWPAMLLSAGLPLPRCVFAHGWWSVTGKKISKSLPATRINPLDLASDVGVDALRYFLLRELPLGLDGDFAFEALIGRINADLANDLGNLLNRSIAMVEEFSEGVVPECQDGFGADVQEFAESVRQRAAEAWEDLTPSRALKATWELIRRTNRYIAEQEPWVLAKNPNARPRLSSVLYVALESLRFAAELIGPVMPQAARQIRTRLGLPPTTTPRWPRWGELASGLRVARGEQLFPRIDSDREKALLSKWLPASDDVAAAGAKQNSSQGATPAGTARQKGNKSMTDNEADKLKPAIAEAGAVSAPAAPAAPASPAAGATTDGTGELTYADFAKLDLRVGIIQSAERVKNADKLLKIMVDLGTETRQVVSGIATVYDADSLIGRRVVVVANLKPAKIRGERSEGMILAAGEKDILALVTLDRDAPPGTKVK